MYLELAEGYTPPPMYNMSERKRKTYVKRYNRSSNTVPGHYRSLSEQDDTPYVYIPDLTGRTAGYQVREDYFDDLTASEWNDLMTQLAPYQIPVRAGMSENMYLAGLFGTRAERKAKREIKLDKKNAKNEIKLARAEKLKNSAGGGGNVLEKISGALGGILGGVLGVPTAPTPGQAPDTTESFWNKKTLGISNKIAVPVGVAIVVGGGAYLYNRKKRKRRK